MSREISCFSEKIYLLLFYSISKEVLKLFHDLHASIVVPCYANLLGKMENDIVLFNMQLPRSIRDDFKIAAKLRGGSMSTLVHQFIVRLIHEEKAKNPRRFPDYVPDPAAEPEVNDQDQQILDMVYESFDGQEVNQDLLKVVLNAVRSIKAATENEGGDVAIFPGNKKVG